MQLYTIETGFFKLDGGAMFGVVPKSIWNKLNPADDNNLCTWAMRSLLIEDGNKLILIDTGIGNKQDDKFFSHYYLHGNDSLDKSLEKLGFHKNDITDVVLTHLHFDHCGGSIIRENELLKPAFPNAIFWSNEAHWKWATQPNAREKASFLKENILPMQESGQLKLIDLPKEKIENQLSSSVFNDAISVRFVQGHTDQMMLPQIKYKDKTIVFMADLLPSVAHLPLPYVMGYDMFPLTTLKEKQVFLEEAANNNYTLFFQHDPTVECCSLQITEKGVRAKEKFSLKEWI
jgi:glyoxylase-like metal-dependent hydrolase (beta-lactamase superfamily II)